MPIIVEYKDNDGNVFSQKFTVNSDGNAGTTGAAAGQNGVPQAPSGAPNNRRPGGMFSFGSGLNQVPVTEIVIILVVIIGILVAWRKGLLKRVSDSLRKKQVPDDDDLKGQ